MIFLYNDTQFDLNSRLKWFKRISLLKAWRTHVDDLYEGNKYAGHGILYGYAVDYNSFPIKIRQRRANIAC